VGAVTGALVLAFDIGGTTARAALARDGCIGGRRSAPTASGRLRATIRKLADELAAEAGSPIAAVGVGVPEYVHQGRVMSSEVIAWNDEIALDLSGIAPTVVIESDVRCGAIAEWSAEPAGSLLYISWGTGLSSTLVLPDGRAWEGDHGRAIAFGERPVSCGSGAASTLERVASGRGVEEVYAARTGRRLTAELIAASADQVAHDVLREAGQLVAAALLDLSRVLDPGRVVVGGGFGLAPTGARRALEHAWAEASKTWAVPPLSLARHSIDAGLVGAALVARAGLGLQPASLS
jgi:glucokinase